MPVPFGTHTYKRTLLPLGGFREKTAQFYPTASVTEMFEDLSWENLELRKSMTRLNIKILDI